MGRAQRPSVVDNAIYVDGRRTDDPPNLEDTYELLRERKGMAWIGLYRPTRDDIMSLAAEFDLHPLAVDDAIAAHQRPKLERYGALLFTVLRPARYFDEPEKVEFGELHVFPGPDYVVTIRHAESYGLPRKERGMENGWLDPGQPRHAYAGARAAQSATMVPVAGYRQEQEQRS